MLRKSASVLVCTSHQNQLKLLMLKRSDYGFYGGLLVFPGGALDVPDAAPEWNCIAKGAKDLEDLSFRICGIRETFEECGLLLCSPYTHASRQDWRAKVIQDPLHFIQFCRTTLCVPDTNKLVYWSNWISPAHHPKRFDTKFYLYCIPQERMNEVEADGRETVGVEWLSPEEILARFAKKEITLLPPQFCQVSELMNKSLDQVQSMALNRKVEPIEPVLIEKTPTVMKMKLPTNDHYNGILHLYHSKDKVFGIKVKL